MDSKKHSSLQDLKKNLLDIYEKNKKQVFDIILFGSAVKGKGEEFREDTDICIIFKGDIDKQIIKEFNNIKGLHINYLSLPELYSQSLWKTLIREGISIVYDKKLSDIFGMEAYGLYTYKLSGLKSKSRFSQVLMGYKSESVLMRVKGKILGKGVILVPMDNVEYFRSFLERWNVSYTLKYIYLAK